jgi:tryptophanyl-tRNA synthetase
MSNELVFSGVQPTGNLHLGNYLGAIKNWIDIQNKYKSIFCIVDLHAITVPQYPKELYNNTLELAAIFIACGIHPEKSIIFPQSAVAGHSELAWILGCNTSLGPLNRMTQYKDKIQSSKKSLDESAIIMRESLRAIKMIVEKNFKKENEENYYIPNAAYNILEKHIANVESISDSLIDTQQKTNSSPLGLFSYPILMAADILLYKATHVPVGEDQKQHLELARDIAGSFNHNYKKKIFPIPEPLIKGIAPRVMSLNDGTRKMSKSEESDYSRINLSDDADTIAKKFQKAKSDSIAEIYYDKDARPDISNLLTIYAALADISIEAAGKEFAGKRTSDFKKAIAELAVEKLAPITSEFNKLKNDKGHLMTILRNGSEQANAIAEKNLKEIKETVGFFV